MIRSAIMIAFCLALLTGCAPQQLHSIGREPALTPVGAGLKPSRVAVPNLPAPPPTYVRGNSFWQDTSADLFRDPRAMKVGDVMTVKISIKDKATLDNTSERKRDNKTSFGLDVGWDTNLPLLNGKRKGTIDSKIDSKSETKGEGAINRSESIELLVAAVVTDVLPNGNLIISGTQEVRVNFEVRVLTVQGMVRPRDISTENMVSYDKIAEARISYGGRGRITDVQQPAWGQQLLDIITPF
ncbi:MAG: flagellar basal body L-ring protein FlgH [Hyphomonadaceae bacterium]|jgi:flagellar L-ring protein precursor FlgH|nr:flagellar basal body L-ring protein FlgH [Hyphomonadaceae bacterium]